MRLVIHRVTNSTLSVDGSVVSEIGKGCVVYVGITHDDTEEEASALAKKLVALRLWDDESGEKPKRWAKSARDYGYELMLVSQFTLYSVLKGTKPDFHLAMEGSKAKVIFDFFVEQVKANYQADKIKTGVFGAHMYISNTVDGPVTIEVEAEHKKN